MNIRGDRNVRGVGEEIPIRTGEVLRREERPVGDVVVNPGNGAPVVGVPINENIGGTPAHEVFGGFSGVSARDLDQGIGSLKPAGDDIEPPPHLRGVVRHADKAWNVDVANRVFNPLRNVIGDYTKGSQVYEGKCIIDVQQIVGGALQAMGQSGDPQLAQAAQVMSPLLPALGKQAVLRTSAHQFTTMNTLFYGGEHGQKNLLEYAKWARSQGIRLFKQMSHIDREGQGGTMKDILSDGVGGTTHTGGFSVGWIDGKEVLIESDWPANYGRLGDSNKTYNAVLFGADYQEACNAEIPVSTRLTWAQNADMIDAVMGLLIPFAGQDLDPRFRNYKFNRLDVHDPASAEGAIDTLTKLNGREFLEQWGSFYCAEGQYSVANAAPRQKNLWTKERLAGTKLAELIDAYQQAPEFQGKDEDWKMKHANLGWKHLHESGKLAELLGSPAAADAAMRDHEATHRNGVYLQYVDAETKGIEQFQPKLESGFLAEPMTVGTMAWMLLRRYMPREGIAQTLAEDIGRAYKDALTTIAQTQGNNAPEALERNKQATAVKGAVDVIFRGAPAGSEQANKALGEFCFRAATGTLLGILKDESFKGRLLQQAGLDLLAEYPADRNDPIYVNGGVQYDENKVGKTDADIMTGVYDKFVQALINAGGSQEATDRALRDVDREARKAQVLMRDWVPLGGPEGTYRPAKMNMMLYAAPQCFTGWGQHPGLFDSHGIRFAAYAQHAEQERVQ